MEYEAETRNEQTGQTNRDTDTDKGMVATEGRPGSKGHKGQIHSDDMVGAQCNIKIVYHRNVHLEPI